MVVCYGMQQHTYNDTTSSQHYSYDCVHQLHTSLRSHTILVYELKNACSSKHLVVPGRLDSSKILSASMSMTASNLLNTSQLTCSFLKLLYNVFTDMCKKIINKKITIIYDRLRLRSQVRLVVAYLLLYFCFSSSDDGLELFPEHDELGVLGNLLAIDLSILHDNDGSIVATILRRIESSTITLDVIKGSSTDELPIVTFKTIEVY